MPYTSDDLKSLSEYMKLCSFELVKKKAEDEKNEDKSIELLQVARQLEALRFNPLLFESLLDEYEVPYSILEESLDTVALHINDISKAIVEWRLTNGI
jgi:hypothetical protein